MFYTDPLIYIYEITAICLNHLQKMWENVYILYFLI